MTQLIVIESIDTLDSQALKTQFAPLMPFLNKWTIGRSVILNQSTFTNVGRQPLPGRQTIVIAPEATGVNGVLTAYSLKAALALAQYEVAIIESFMTSSLLDVSDCILHVSTQKNDSFASDIDEEAWTRDASQQIAQFTIHTYMRKS